LLEELLAKISAIPPRSSPRANPPKSIARASTGHLGTNRAGLHAPPFPRHLDHARV